MQTYDLLRIRWVLAVPVPCGPLVWMDGWLLLDLLGTINDSLCFIMSFNEFLEGLNRVVLHQAGVYADL